MQVIKFLLILYAKERFNCDFLSHLQMVLICDKINLGNNYGKKIRFDFGR